MRPASGHWHSLLHTPHVQVLLIAAFCLMTALRGMASQLQLYRLLPSNNNLGLVVARTINLSTQSCNPAANLVI